MLVADLNHFLDLPDDAAGPTVRLAGQLIAIVRAATARAGGRPWVSALTCSRRPNRQPCSGVLAIERTDVPSSISWWCTSCGDDGVITHWERSLFDLREHSTAPSLDQVATITVDADIAAILRTVMLLDTDVERVVYAARTSDSGRVVLEGSPDTLGTLIESVAADAKNEPNRRRQQQLDYAYDALT